MVGRTNQYVLQLQWNVYSKKIDQRNNGSVLFIYLLKIFATHLILKQLYEADHQLWRDKVRKYIQYARQNTCRKILGNNSNGKSLINWQCILVFFFCTTSERFKYLLNSTNDHDIWVNFRRAMHEEHLTFNYYLFRIFIKWFKVKHICRKFPADTNNPW